MKKEALREKIVNLRREAYVQAVIRSSLSEDVIGYIGRKIPVDVLHGFDLGVLPVDSTDRDILAYSEEKCLCPLIDATYTYARTDKCPLIHSAKVIVMDDSCKTFLEKMTGLLGDRILPFKDRETLIGDLERLYGKPFDRALYEEEKQKLARIDHLCETLAERNIPSRFLYETEFYNRFIFDTDKRIELLKQVLEAYPEKGCARQDVYVPRGVQILDEIDARYDNYRIREGALCVGEKVLPKHEMDISYTFCTADM